LGAKFVGHSGSAPGISVHNGQQADGFSLLLELMVDAGVVTAEGASANDCHVDEVAGCQLFVLRL
jgi:hypothetical protein